MLSAAKRSWRFVLVMVVLVSFAELLAGCDVIDFLMPEDALSGGTMSQTQNEDNGDTSASEGDAGLVALACPSEYALFELSFNHTWTFDPGNAGQVVIEGETVEGAVCFLSVEGRSLSFEPCVIGYSNTGSVGPCSVSGQSQAYVTAEGYCEDGLIVIEITEIGDPDAELDATMSCPGAMSQPYMSVYAPTISHIVFDISTSGAAGHQAGAVPQGYSYDKNWVLRAISLPSDD